MTRAEAFNRSLHAVPQSAILVLLPDVLYALHKETLSLFRRKAGAVRRRHPMERDAAAVARPDGGPRRFGHALRRPVR